MTVSMDQRNVTQAYIRGAAGRPEKTRQEQQRQLLSRRRAEDSEIIDFSSAADREKYIQEAGEAYVEQMEEISDALDGDGTSLSEVVCQQLCMSAFNYNPCYNDCMGDDDTPVIPVANDVKKAADVDDTSDSNLVVLTPEQLTQLIFSTARSVTTYSEAIENVATTTTSTSTSTSTMAAAPTTKQVLSTPVSVSVNLGTTAFNDVEDNPVEADLPTDLGVTVGVPLGVTVPVVGAVVAYTAVKPVRRVVNNAASVAWGAISRAGQAVAEKAVEMTST